MTTKRVATLFALICLTASLGMATVTYNIGPNCVSCQGGVYTLEETLVSTGVSGDVYYLKFTSDTTTYTGGGSYIDSVALKPANAIISAALLNAPPPAGVWSVGLGGLNAGGCSGAGSGYFCSESTGLGATLANSINIWTSNVLVAHGENVFSFTPIVKILFTSLIGDKIGALVSTEMNFVTDGGGGSGDTPEPSTLVMFALGGIFGFPLARRKWRLK